MFVHVEGPLDELRSATMLKGIEFARGVRELGGGVWRASAYVTRKSALDELRARGLTVRVYMDSEETDRRMRTGQ